MILTSDSAADSLVARSIAEAKRAAVQSAIDAGRSLAERNRLGQFATPAALAEQVARHALRHFLSGTSPDTSDVRFGEPSVGTGAFFAALLRALGDGEKRLASAVGVEIDQEFAAAACDLWNAHGLQVVVGDFTDADVIRLAAPRPNLLLANPPYVRHHHLTVEQKDRLRAGVARTTGIPVNGLTGLYVYFVLLAHEWLEEDGVASWLIPSEWMEVNYGAALRSYLTERVTLLDVHRYDPATVQFGDALVSSTVVTFRKSPPPAGWAARFTFGGTLDEPARTQRVPLVELRGARKWTAYPRILVEAAAADDPMPVSGFSLGDLFRIRRGIATGANEFFVLERSEARERGFSEDCLRPILPSPRYLRGRIVERRDDGYPCLDSPLCVIDTDLPEKELCTRHPTLWAYLEEGRRTGLLDRYLISKRKPWYRQEQRPPAPFLCTYMGRGNGEGGAPFRFLLNRSDAIAPNVFLMLYPMDALADLLRRRPACDAEVLSVLEQITAESLRGEGRVYGGGLHKIEPKELERIPAGAFIDRFPELAPLRLFEKKTAYLPGGHGSAGEHVTTVL